MHRIISTLAVLVVCVAVSACANQVQNKEDMLAASGFTVVPANTPQRQTSLTTLPPHKFVQQVRNNAVIYVYSDPTICECRMSAIRLRTIATARTCSRRSSPMSRRSPPRSTR